MSGVVKVTVGGAEYPFTEPFTVTRLSTRRRKSWRRITVGTLYGDAAGSGPNYAVEVAKGKPTLVAASAGEADPVLMAIVTDTPPPDDLAITRNPNGELALEWTGEGLLESGPEVDWPLEPDSRCGSPLRRFASRRSAILPLPSVTVAGGAYIDTGRFGGFHLVFLCAE